MQAIKIKNRGQLIANQQLRAQMAERQQQQKQQRNARFIHRLVVFLTAPGAGEP